ncbi:MAG: hypothetical protein ABI595_12635 [Actinomycetota bacterium]
MIDLRSDDLEQRRNRSTQGCEATSEHGQIAKAKSFDLVAKPSELISQDRNLALEYINLFSLGRLKRLLCHVSPINSGGSRSLSLPSVTGLLGDGHGSMTLLAQCRS